MDYRKFIKSSNINFQVNDHLIECDLTTWQIRNIAATSISKRVIPFKEPEPLFTTPKPVFQINWFIMLIFAAIVWWFVERFFHIPVLSIFGAILVIGIFIYSAIESLRASESRWQREKERMDARWNIWNEMRLNPPILYSLMLETNAGSKPLFYSLDEAQIVKANSAIKRSMEKKEQGDIKFEIETVNIGGDDSINNFGSSIYAQSIQGC